MELLETTALSHEIEKLIKDSNDFTIIVSPYLKINNRLKPKLSECFNRNNRNLVIYRDNELTNDEKKWLNSYTNVTLIPIKNLHAKSYINENTAIIASMNLYDYSQINNHEIGVKISFENDNDAMNELLKIIGSIIKTDYPSFDFSDYKGFKVNYTMGGLYSDLIKDYEFPDKFQRTDGTYEYMCKIAIQHYNFENSDFKSDKSGLKRSATLNSTTYWNLRKELIKKGKLKT